MDLQGKRVLVTGATRGIGEAIAREVAGRGALVAGVARNAELLEKVMADIGGTAHPADLTDTAGAIELVDRVERGAGPIDILVNNAGLGEATPFVAYTEAEIDHVYAVNLLAPVHLCRQVIPRMQARGRGHVVNVSSLAGVAGFAGLAVYSSTKAGLTNFGRVLQMELKGSPVNLTTVELGPIPTDMLDQVNEYGPTRRSFDRFYKLQLLVDIPREQVATAVADAIEHERSWVRLPRRAVIFPVLSNLPNRLVRFLLTGVEQR